MKVVVGHGHRIHNPRWEFTRGRRIYSKDIPSRATVIQEALEAADMGVEFLPPEEHPLDAIADTHAYFAYIRAVGETLGTHDIIYPDVFPVRRKVRCPSGNAALAGYYCFDTGTPLTRNTFLAAKASVDVALTASSLLPDERVVYALCRPPGHHAEREVFGGYCYFNNPALAAKQLRHLGRVAVLDLDFHHGNGTQDIFYENPYVLTVSIHGDPEQVYPYFSGYADERGAGVAEGTNLNLPLAPGSKPDRFLEALDTALAAIREFDPASMVLALGFDTCKGDPAGSFDLLTKHYPVIAHRVAQEGYPTLIVQEGGYRTETLGKNAVSFLKAFEKGARR